MSARVVTLAREWIGTPYVHQASCRGAGCDCLGLIRGLWRELYGAEPEAAPPYTMDWDEPQRQERLWQAAARHLAAKPVDEAAPGDVILFRMREGAVAKHLGVQSSVPEPTAESFTSNPAFIHAYAGHGVVESPLTRPWQRRIVARFHFPKEQI